MNENVTTMIGFRAYIPNKSHTQTSQKLLTFLENPNRNLLGYAQRILLLCSAVRILENLDFDNGSRLRTALRCTYPMNAAGRRNGAAACVS